MQLQISFETCVHVRVELHCICIVCNSLHTSFDVTLERQGPSIACYAVIRLPYDHAPQRLEGSDFTELGRTSQLRGPMDSKTKEPCGDFNNFSSRRAPELKKTSPRALGHRDMAECGNKELSPAKSSRPNRSKCSEETLRTLGRQLSGCHSRILFQGKSWA